jgi:hypothetical protein
MREREILFGGISSWLRYTRPDRGRAVSYPVPGLELCARHQLSVCCQRLRWWAQHPWALVTLARSDRALARTATND